MWQNIPMELRAYSSWVAAGPNKVPLNPRTGELASVTDPGTWGTYDEAVRSGYKHIGFVLSDRDPYSIIDLDNKPERPISPEVWQLHQKILAEFQSYTERSASGRGYHVIVRGRVPDGVNNKAASLEVYSTQRYMICTGDVVPDRNLPIADLQEGLDYLHREFRSYSSEVDLQDVPCELSDAEVVEMGDGAVNGEKFRALCNGLWQELGYESQSEADFALLSMLAYYTPDNEQVRRIFRLSGLGQRDKALRDDYLNRALRKIRANIPPPLELDAFVRANAKNLAGDPVEDGGVTEVPTSPGEVPGAVPGSAGEVKGPQAPPPGLVGDLANYFYRTAVRPVPEIALSSALALTAGVAGRSYNVSGTGLNLYIILLARTGSGKEGAARGIETLISAVRPTVPMVDEFIGPATFASGQAIVRYMDEHPCFVSILGEFGLTLQAISDPQANATQLTLRKVLLDLYSKSGGNSVLRNTIYSDQEKNTKMVQSPALTLLAESTPETFFEGLDLSHIAEGLVPRFSVIEYEGKRPHTNPNAGAPPDPELVRRFSDLVFIALSSQQNSQRGAPVAMDAEGRYLLDLFDRETTDIINEAQVGPVESQLWNRAHLKALKIAGLLAVGVAPHQPVITRELAEWAITFVRREVVSISTRYARGDVGKGNGKQVHDLRRISLEYVRDSPEKLSKSYAVDKRLAADKIIPYAYFQRRTASLGAYRSDRMGASHALRMAIAELVDSGFLVEVTQVHLKRYGMRGKAYVVINNRSTAPAPEPAQPAGAQSQANGANGVQSHAGAISGVQGSQAPT